MRQHKIDKEVALLRCADICSKGEHCESEIREKLFKWGIDNADRDDIIDYLYENKFIDDQRFAHAFANDKVKFNAWGRIKISLALRQKRIPTYIIDQAINEIDLQIYRQNLHSLVVARAKIYDIADYTQRNNVYRQLIAKGYEPHLISDAISSYLTDK